MNPDFAKYTNGLVPAIVQDVTTNKVLMLGFMNAEALEKTKSENKVTFFSRSKQRLWTKGETSNNFLLVKEILTDCDNDTILIKASPTGPVCHTGADTCFNETNKSIDFIYLLEEVIAGHAVPRHALLPHLHHELAILRELEDVPVHRTVAANPDVAAAVDVESVVAVGPLIAGTVAAAPVAQQIAGLIELENRWRGVAALAGRRRLARCAFRRVQHGRPMDDPDVVLRIDPEPDGLALIPAVG
jgi:phosphoribosyl-AMP cyclohydrolase